MTSYEVNCDGLIGPTHAFCGLGFGNPASMSHKMQPSHPKQAALQGLQKMGTLAALGIKQIVLPPQERPLIAPLRRLGFDGTDEEVLASAMKASPELVYACSSASSVWTANGATISPSVDCADKRVHITPANLASHFHRSLESIETYAILGQAFPEDYFCLHAPLPLHTDLGDEGSANWIRLAPSHAHKGVELFVYGREPSGKHLPARYPARQSLIASQAIVRLHHLEPDRVVFAQQTPRLIDAGIFHNDLAAVGNEDFLIYTEHAWIDTPQIIDEVAAKLAHHGGSLKTFMISEEELPLHDLIDSYLLNSQLVTLPSGGMALIAPTRCQEVPTAAAVIERLLSEDNPVQSVTYLDLSESMGNGGGPACLRLRAVLTEKELAKVHHPLVIDDTKLAKLSHFVHKHYRDTLLPSELADPNLLYESRLALDELTQILQLGPLYSFQQ